MKKILITGASSGFGKMLVEQLSAQNNEYIIYAAIRHAETSNRAVKRQLQQLPNVEVVSLDVTSDTSVNHAVQYILQHHQSIDILINNAGVFGGGLLEAHSIEQVQRLFDINVYGPLRLMKAVLPSMRDGKDGLIINVSSMLGFFSIPLNTVYCASKFALEALVTGSYTELLPLGIENILVEPGTFPTELYSKSGIKADLPEITAAYNGLADQMADYAGQAVSNAIREMQPDAHSVVSKIIALIEMEKGATPHA